MVLKITCLMLFVLGCAQSSVLPVEKCELQDSTCMTPAFQKMIPVFVAGMPDQNVDLLDPLKMDNVSFDFSGLKYTLDGGTLKGLKNVVVESVDWNTNKKAFTVVYYTDVILKGHYTANGRILILPITGDGPITIKLNHLEIKLFVKYDVVKGTNGKEYIKPKKYNLDFEVKNGAHYNLENLFNGNKELSDTMLSFLNDNWKQITSEFGRPVIDSSSKTIFRNMIKFFEAMPIEELAIV